MGCKSNCETHFSHKAMLSTIATDWQPGSLIAISSPDFNQPLLHLGDARHIYEFWKRLTAHLFLKRRSCIWWGTAWLQATGHWLSKQPVPRLEAGSTILLLESSTSREPDVKGNTVIEIEPPKSPIHKLCLNTWVYKTRCTQLHDCGCMGREKPTEGWPELWGSPARLANRSKHKLWLGLWGRFSHVLHETRVNVLNSSLLWPKPCLHSYVVWSRFQSECLIHIQTAIPLRNTIFSLALNIHTMSITYLCNQVQLYQAAYLGYETNVSTKKSQNKRAWIKTLERDRWRE